MLDVAVDEVIFTFIQAIFQYRFMFIGFSAGFPVEARLDIAASSVAAVAHAVLPIKDNTDGTQLRPASI